MTDETKNDIVYIRSGGSYPMVRTAELVRHTPSGQTVVKSHTGREMRFDKNNYEIGASSSYYREQLITEHQYNEFLARKAIEANRRALRDKVIRLSEQFSNSGWYDKEKLVLALEDCLAQARDTQ